MRAADATRRAVSVPTRFSIVVDVQAPVLEGGEQQGGREGLGIGRDPGQGLRHRTAVCAAGRVEIVGLDERRGPAHHLGVGVKRL